MISGLQEASWRRITSLCWGLAARSVATTEATTVTTVTTATATTTIITATTTTSFTTATTFGSVNLLGGLLKPLGMLDERGRDVVGSGPEIGGKESVGVGNGVEGSLNEVLGGTGASGRASVTIVDTSELQDLLGNGGSDKTSTSGGGGQLKAD